MLKRIYGPLFLLALCASGALAQEKGVDTQNSRIRDEGSQRAPGQNGRNQNTGTGRGIDFGRTPAPPPVANPYRFSTRRDLVINSVEELMQEQKLVLDTANSNRAEGVLVSQPFSFVRGAVVAIAEISRYADLPRDNVRGWTRGRYTLLVEVRALDGVTTSVAVNARIEGRSDSAAGSEWVSLTSNGEAEREFIIALVEKLTGAPPRVQ